MIQLLVLFSLATTVLTHNWIASPSRNRFASTAQPCSNRRDSTPSVVVGKDQDFQIEYVTGHGAKHFSYFVLIKAEDESMLKTLREEDLQEYIDNGPSNQQGMPEPIYRKYHRKEMLNSESSILDNNVEPRDRPVVMRPSFFSRVVDEDDPLYVPRPTRFGANKTMMAFKEEDLINDRIVSYDNPKWPFIFSVRKYSHASAQASRPDFIRFKMPEGLDTGNYIVWWYWRGYRDCIDVSYRADIPKVADVYGTPGPIEWERIENAGMPDFKYAATNCMEVTDDLLPCWYACKAEFRCTAIVVAPAILPDRVPESFRDFALPWSSWYVNDKKERVQRRNYTCERNDFLHATKDTMICVGISPRESTDVFAEFETTKDPTAPYFYSTVYMSKKSVTFQDQPPATPNLPLSWRPGQGKHCVKCQSVRNFDQPTRYKKAVSYTSDQIPTIFRQWQFADDDKCVNCDREPAPYIAPFEPYSNNAAYDLLGFTDMACDGMIIDANYHTRSKHVPEDFEFVNPANAALDSCTNRPQECYKQLLFPGQDHRILFNRSRPMTCNLMASRDSECADDVLMTGVFQVCYCRRKNPASCCGPCNLEKTRKARGFKVKRDLAETWIERQWRLQALNKTINPD